ncbi:autophagocytosis associated protein [Phycomyces nitens]|nr:autophagocytosis associated protein [Phycomyces nitens]
MFSRQEFDKAADSLAIASNGEWIVAGQPKRSCLVLPGDEIEIKNENEIEEEDDEACGNLVSQRLLTVEHHIVYSATYRVPVLYFVGYHADGAPLSFEEVYDWVVPECYRDSLRLAHTSTQGSLTQTDHPHLGVPAWFLHPCDTSSLMAAVGAGQLEPTRYLVSWLSLMGPVLSCNVSTELFTHQALPKMPIDL